MASDTLSTVKDQIALRVAELRASRPSPIDIHASMSAIRELAADNGLDALEGLARRSAQMALLPGHRVRLNSCFEHMAEALDSRCARDRTAILAALAIRLH